MPCEYRLRVVQQSDTGRQREINEDCFGRLEADDASLYVLADGMGGHAAGEVASRLAVDTILSAFEASDPQAGPVERVRGAILQANAAVYARGSADVRLAGMGTTVVVAVVSGSGLTLANVGDSRGYLLRDGVLTQLTHDHSWVAKAVENGLMTPAQAWRHPDRSVIYRSLGAELSVQIDTFSHDLRAEDRVVLCSDGLTDVVEDSLLAELAGDPDPARAVQRLIDAANDAGGPDNITVTLIVIDAFPERKSDDRPTSVDGSAPPPAPLPAVDAVDESAQPSASATPPAVVVGPARRLAERLRRLIRSRF